METYGYVYETTNISNSCKYIGRKKGEFDSHYFGSGILIKRALKKYGASSFEVKVLTTTENKEKLDELERFYIAEYKRIFGRKSYNLAKGGEGGIGGATNKGEKRIHNKTTGEERFVSLQEIDKFLSDGWSLGRVTGYHRKAHKDGCLCTPCGVNRGEHKEGCDCFGCRSRRGENKGELNPMFGSHRFGEECPTYGTRWMYNRQMDKQKMVKQVNIQDYIANGWVIGMRGQA